MALAAAFADVKSNQSRSNGDAEKGVVGGRVKTTFFGAAGKAEIPHADLLQFDPGRITYPHYHGVDQYQVVIEGKGKMGRHDIDLYSIHFSRANTPYGPLVSDSNAGLSCFNLHASSATAWGSHHLPKERENLSQIADRQPFQVTSHAAFPAPESPVLASGVALQAIPDIKDEQGLAAYTLSMKPNTKTHTPDAAHGNGQYVAVVKGSVLHDGKELKSPALVFVSPKEGRYLMHAGAHGLEALVLNFPTPLPQTENTAKSKEALNGFKTWQCELCSFVYDEAAGLPVEGIAPGTRWQDVPDTWSCPDCAASKSDFQMSELKQ